MTKTCTKCRAVKPVSEFRERPRYADGLSTWCRECERTYNRSWMKQRRADRPDEERRRSLLRYHGMTLDEFRQLVAEHDGRCAICGTPDGERLHVDHDHDTGRIRGLLCGPCNRGLGLFGDDHARLLAAALYLTSNSVEVYA